MTVLRILAVSVWLAGSVGACAAASARGRLAVTRIADTIVDPAALNFTASYTGCLNGKAFQQDGVVSHNGWQYATYFDGGRRLCLGRRSLAGNTWEVIRFADYVQKANDRHNVAVVGVCPGDGTLHLAFDHHASPLHYRVSRKGAATNPAGVTWDASLFGTTTSQLEAGKRLVGITYPRFVTTPAGGLQLWYRVGGSGNGDSHLAEYDPTRGTWRQVGLMIARTGRYGQSASRCPYLNGLDYDRRGRLHVTWCWRETPNVMTNHDLCHAYSEDQGRSWCNSAGARIARPGKGGDRLDVSSPGIVFRALPTSRGLINATAQAVDSHGRPHVVTWHLPDGAAAPSSWRDARERSRYFHYWLDGKGNWRRVGLGFVGGRPKLVLGRNDDAYLVFAGQRAFGDLQIAAASARSEYANWEVAHRDTGRPTFTGEPLIDPRRWAREGILSVYIQERPRGRRLSRALHVVDYRLGPSR